MVHEEAQGRLAAAWNSSRLKVVMAGVAQDRQPEKGEAWDSWDREQERVFSLSWGLGYSQLVECLPSIHSVGTLRSHAPGMLVCAWNLSSCQYWQDPGSRGS